MTSDSPLFGSKTAIARCPKCHEFIAASSQTCRFCHAVLTLDELQVAVTLQRKITSERARINNRRALIYSVLSLGGVVALGLARFSRELSKRDLTLPLIGFAVANKVSLTVLIGIPVIVVIILGPPEGFLRKDSMEPE